MLPKMLYRLNGEHVSATIFRWSWMTKGKQRIYKPSAISTFWRFLSTNFTKAPSRKLSTCHPPEAISSTTTSIPEQYSNTNNCSTAPNIYLTSSETPSLLSKRQCPPNLRKVSSPCSQPLHCLCCKSGQLYLY